MRLQPLVRARLESLGAEGEAWREALPGLVSDLAQQWRLELGRPLAGGSASVVVEVTDHEGRERVLKVGLPHDRLEAEARTLEAAHGHGYVRLYDADLDRRALLLERLGPSLERVPLPPEQVLEALTTTLRAAWSLPLGVAPAVAPGEDKASCLRRLLLDLVERHPDACDQRVLDQAVAYAEELAAEDHDEVVVHGDAQPPNLLRAPRRPGDAFAFVDPDGFRADPAYDLGVAVRDWTRRLEGSADPRGLLRGYCERLAADTGLDADRIWRWGFLERVSTGLYVLDFGGTAIGRRFLDSAVRLLD